MGVDGSLVDDGSGAKRAPKTAPALDEEVVKKKLYSWYHSQKHRPSIQDQWHVEVQNGPPELLAGASVDAGNHHQASKNDIADEEDEESREDREAAEKKKAFELKRKQHYMMKKPESSSEEDSEDGT